MATEPFVLPGDILNSETLPSHPKKALKVGPGLMHILPNSVVSMVAGRVYTDKKKNAVWLEYNAGRVCLRLIDCPALLILGLVYTAGR